MEGLTRSREKEQILNSLKVNQANRDQKNLLQSQCIMFKQQHSKLNLISTDDCIIASILLYLQTKLFTKLHLNEQTLFFFLFTTMRQRTGKERQREKMSLVTQIGNLASTYNVKCPKDEI